MDCGEPTKLTQIKGFLLKKKIYFMCVCAHTHVHTPARAHMHAGVCGSQGMSDPLAMELQLDVGAQN